MLDLIWFIPLLPLAGAVLNLVLGRKFGDPRAGWVATIATWLISFDRACLFRNAWT